MRTTIDIDETVLRELKRLQQKEKKSLGRLVSDLLAAGLREKKTGAASPRTFSWHSQPMDARVDLGDRDAVLDILDREDGSGEGGRR